MPSTANAESRTAPICDGNLDIAQMLRHRRRLHHAQVRIGLLASGGERQ